MKHGAWTFSGFQTHSDRGRFGTERVRVGSGQDFSNVCGFGFKFWGCGAGEDKIATSGRLPTTSRDLGEQHDIQHASTGHLPSACFACLSLCALIKLSGTVNTKTFALVFIGGIRLKTKVNSTSANDNSVVFQLYC